MSVLDGTVVTMNGIDLFIGLTLGILLGLLLGAAVAWILASKRHQSMDTELRTQLAESTHAQAIAQGRLDEIGQRRDQEAESARERESLLEVLHPVRLGVTELQRRIQDLERDRAAQHSQLSHQLTTAAQSDAKLLESTQALLGSLHSTSARGHWGEVQLRRVVEAAGMRNQVDFTEQTTTKVDDAVLRPDMVVHLPEGRQLVLDAKAPLHPDDPQLQAKALRSRVDELASKRYWRAVEISPDVVFCFIPAESMLAAALDADPTLLDSSLAKGVTLVSPASLLAALKAVETAWRQERLSANITTVVEHSRELYSRLVKMSEYLGETGQRISQAVTAYNKLVGSIERRVLPQAEALGQVEVAGPDATKPSRHQGGLRAEQVSAQVRPLGPRLTAAESEENPAGREEPSAD